MNSENVWVPWNERNDLKIMYFIYEYTVGFGYCYFPKNLPFEEYTPGSNHTYIRRFICIGKTPNNKDFIDKFHFTFFKKFQIYRNKEFGGCSRLILNSKYSIVIADKLSSDERLLAHEYTEYVKNEDSFLYSTVLEIRNSLENFDKHESDIIPSQTIDISASAPVAAVPPAAPADITSIRPYPQIFAKSGDNVEQTPDNGAVGMIVAGNTARAADGIERLINVVEKVVERQDKSIEIQTQTANNTASINAKMPGKITRIEDIPPLDLRNPNWKTAQEYAKIKGLSVEALRSNRSSGDKSDDGKAGFHNGHAWRSKGEGSKTKVYYYLYH